MTYLNLNTKAQRVAVARKLVEKATKTLRAVERRYANCAPREERAIWASWYKASDALAASLSALRFASAKGSETARIATPALATQKVLRALTLCNALNK